MNLEQLSSPLPKPWLSVSADAVHARVMDTTTITSGAVETDTVDASGSVSTNLLFLDISGILPRPGDPLIACVNASDDFAPSGVSRLKVNTTAGTETLAYISEIDTSPDKIQADDGEAEVSCLDGGQVLGRFNNGGTFLEVNKDLDYTSVYNQSGSCDVTCASDGIYLRSTGLITVAGGALKLQDYSMPRFAGSFGQSLITNGSADADWGFPEEVRSPDALSFARCSNGLISLSQSGVGRVRVDPGLSLLASPNAVSSFLCSDASAIVRHNGVDGIALTAGGLDFPTGATTRGLAVASGVFSSYSPVVVSGGAESTILGLTTGSLILPVGAFSAGSTWRFELGGSYSLSPPQTVRFRIYKGAGQLLVDTGALSMDNSPGAFSLSCLLTIQASGVAGVAVSNSVSTARLDTIFACVAFANSTTFNTTTTTTISATAQFGVANADTLTCRQIIMSRLI
jgi:hypothetical protein